MQGLSSWSNNEKDYFGLKTHIATDLNRKLPAVKFTSGNADDGIVFVKLNNDLLGLFIADAGYISEKPQKDFYLEGKRILLVKLRKNTRKVMTRFQEFFYGTRMFSVLRAMILSPCL